MFLGRNSTLVLPPPALPGDFQRHNAGLALEALEQIRPDLPIQALAQGLETIHWPARLQRLRHGPLVEMLPPGWELWLDGGHNPHAAEALAQHARTWRDKPLLGVFGILGTKDVDGYLGPLATRFHTLRTVAIPGEANSLSAEDGAAAATRHFCLDAKPAASVAAAVRELIDRGPGPARILICGSLYLAGTVLSDNG